MVVALVVRGDRLLLVRHAVRGREPFWHFPWGRSTREGVPPERVAMRVAAEITGLDVTEGRVVHEQAHPTSGRWMTYVRCEIADSGGAEIEGEFETAWVTEADLPVFMPRSVRPVPPKPVFPDMDAARAAGPAARLEARWETLSLRWGWSERDSTGAGRGLVDLIAAARAEPRLAQLYPYTSHHMLCLSACMQFPYQVVAQVRPMSDGSFRVHVPRTAELIGTTDTAEDAVALVLEHLPADIGPAQDTTARFLKQR